MENATKALTMAAGILIALVIISVIVILFTRIAQIKKSELNTEEARQIEEFNSEYTKYRGKLVYGTEVITTINRANEDGIKVKVDDEQITGYLIKKADIENYLGNVYKCENITYNEKGKVSEIMFKKLTNRIIYNK